MQYRQIKYTKFLQITFFLYFCRKQLRRIMNPITKRQLSVLIPSFNYVCVNLVGNLQKQAESLGLDYEIIVADDGSTDRIAVSRNAAINDFPHCTYIIRDTNVGRAAIRNFLAQRSRYRRLLFLDCDMELPDGSFIERYMRESDCDVTDGGIRIGGDGQLLRNNIRYLYEHDSEPRHIASERARSPYRSFRTTNFMISRDTMLANPFDERFRFYGYEDVFFGKRLMERGTGIRHIDNPMVLTDFEPNDVFIAKTEEAMDTLYKYRDDLRGFSQLLDVVDRLRPALPLIKLWHRLLGRAERRNLTGRHPSLTLFHIYRIGYYISLIK